MYTEDSEILISTALEVVSDSVALCHEVGAMCEGIVTLIGAGHRILHP